MTTTGGQSFLATSKGKLTLALLCSIAFLDFVDASIVNIALPSIRSDLGFSVSALAWVPSAYLLTYGGLMLLGGRTADLLGRRPVLVVGIWTIGISSLIGGFANSEAVLIGARLAQGLGAAMTLPAALSILTTSFPEGRDRNVALGAWAGMAGLASAAGVMLGGLLTEGPGWRWVMFVNPIACVLVLVAVHRLIAADRRRGALVNFDARGAVLATGGMLLLVYSLIEAPNVGWGTARTIAGIGGALALIGVFFLNERLAKAPLAPLSIFRINGLAFADITLMISAAGLIAMFFFITLYMQGVLGYSPIQTAAAYLPFCGAFVISAGASSALIPKLGTRAMIVGGSAIGAVGLFVLSRISVGGSFTADLLPGMLIIAFGFGPAFVGVTTAGNAGVPADKAGLAASLLNASQQLGAALGLAVLTALATGHTNSLLESGSSSAQALNSGLRLGLLVGSMLIAASAFVALRATDTRGEGVEELPGGGRHNREDEPGGHVSGPSAEPAGA